VIFVIIFFLGASEASAGDWPSAWYQFWPSDCLRRVFVYY
jgi:hypothetical protein